MADSEGDRKFSLTEGDLGGPSRWVRGDILGVAEQKSSRDEFLGVYSAEGYICEDPKTQEAFLAESPDGSGKTLTMGDILPMIKRGDRAYTQITVRLLELPEEDEISMDTSNDPQSIPLWSSRS